MPEGDRRRLGTLIVEAALSSFGERNVAAVILKGSALKGDFVRGWSDFDVHCFIRPGTALMLDSTTPALSCALAFQASIGPLQPMDFGVYAIQVFFIDSSHFPAHWTPLVPGGYEVLFGTLPPTLPAPQAERFLETAREFFAPVLRAGGSLIARAADKPDARLPDLVRLLGSYLKPVAYNAAILRGAPPLEVWLWPLARVLPLVEPDWCRCEGLSGFFEEVWDWSAASADPKRLRAMLNVGSQALREVGLHAVADHAATDRAEVP